MHDRYHSDRRRRPCAAPPARSHGASLRLRRRGPRRRRSGPGPARSPGPAPRGPADLRPRDARGRRHDGPGPHARPQDHGPGHRADGTRDHRHGHLGHAGRRHGFRRETGRRRAAVGLDQECPPLRSARGRSPPDDAARLRCPHVPRHRDEERRHGPRDPARRTGRALDHPGADRGRIGGRQGADGARHPGWVRPQGQAFRAGELRRAAREPDRVHPLRSRERGLHGRDRKAPRQVRRGERRHAVPRRDRRIAARGAGQAAPRPAGGRGGPGRCQAFDQGRRPADLGHQPESDRTREERPVSRRPVSTG